MCSEATVIDVDALSEAISRLLKDQELCARLSSEASRRARGEFSWEAACTRLAKVFAEQGRDLAESRSSQVGPTATLVDIFGHYGEAFCWQGRTLQSRLELADTWGVRWAHDSQKQNILRFCGLPRALAEVVQMFGESGEIAALALVKKGYLVLR